MVHVEVEVIKHDVIILFPAVEETVAYLFTLLHGEFAPCADADASCVPAQARLVRGFAQPEVAMVEETKFVFFVKDRLMLATALAVVATDTDKIVAVEAFEHVLKLSPQHFLCTEKVGSHEVHLVADHLAAFLPLVALDAVVPGLVADVVGADEHLLGIQLKSQQKE